MALESPQKRPPDYYDNYRDDHEVLQTLAANSGWYHRGQHQGFTPDYVITWEKGYTGGAWNPEAHSIRFSRDRPRNSSTDLRTVHFECQQSPWRRDRTFRRTLARLRREGEEPIELSVITSHPRMDMQDVVWAICRRWLQENDFKYLDTHFGINQLTSRDSAAFRERAADFRDRPVDSPEYRELKTEIQGLETRLARMLLKLRRARNRGESLQTARTAVSARGRRLEARVGRLIERLKSGLPRPKRYGGLETELRQFDRTRRKLERDLAANACSPADHQKEVDRLEGRIEPLEIRLCDALRRESRLRLLVDADYRLLETRKKAMMDALRVTAPNVFRNLQERFRAICDNFRDDHTIVRMLTRSSGTVERTPDAVTITLWLPGTLQPHRIEALETLLHQLQPEINRAIPDARPLRLRLATGPQSG
jgi:predicted  nucleic acid-binding Zn-ribbon protein